MKAIRPRSLGAGVQEPDSDRLVQVDMTTDSARALPALRPDRDTPQYGMKGGCTRRVMTTGEARGHGVMQRRRARAGQCRAGAAERTSPTIAKQRICSTQKPSLRSQPARCRAARPGPRRLARKPRPAPTTTANPQVSGPRRNAQGQILRRSESCSANGRVIQLPHICALVPLGFTSASAARRAEAHWRAGLPEMWISSGARPPFGGARGWLLA